MKKFFITLMCIVMVVCFMPTVAFADGGTGATGEKSSEGSIMRAYLNTDRITVDMNNVTFFESVALELYSGETLLTKSTLNTELLQADTYGELTGMISLTAADEYWSYKPWTPEKNVVPDKVKLIVDGAEKDEGNIVVVFNGEETRPITDEDWKTLKATVYTASGSIERAGAITHGNGILKNAVSVDLKDVAFNKSVKVNLYSGKTLLTTATLQGLDAGSYPFLTCCIATETADVYWPLTDWTPRADLVPNKAVLIVDGSKVAEKEFNLNAGEWKQLSGVKSSEGKIMRAYLNTDRITVDMNNVTFFESVALELYSGETLLTKSTLNTELLQADTYGELTGMISLTAADEYWSYKPWTPEKNVVPDKVKLIVDGAEKDEGNIVVVFNGEETRPITDEDWKTLKATVYTASGSIERAAITHGNGILKNAVSVDLKDVAFNKSVKVNLYSGKTLLTTATLQGLDAGSYPFLTCCIATETADEYWPLTPWTPKDEVIPNEAVLIVDGHELHTKAFTLDKTEWANLPGTEAPQNSSGWYYTDPLRPARTEAANAVANYVNPADYEEAQQAEIKTIVDNAKKNIEAAKTADEIKAIEAAAKAELDKLETAEEMSLIRAIGETKFVARSKAVTLKNGKKAIKITWYDKNGKEVKFDGVEIFRSTKRYSGYGKEPIYVSKSGVYYNTAIEAGTKYYYKVRGYVLVNGEKVYTDYSTKAWRTA